MTVPQEHARYPPDVENEHLGSSPTSSGSKERYHAEFYDEANVTEFPFPAPKNRGVSSPHSRSHLLKRETGRENNGKESRPRRSSSHSRHSSSATLLSIANDRLNLAYTRNATLETQKEELLVRFAALIKDKASLEAELRSTQESLRLHQVQLELAQKELHRANDVVRKVDQVRVQAENEVDRLRSRVRHLEAEKLTRQGWEEGWDIGFQEGLERAQAESGLVNRFLHRRRPSSSRQRTGSRDGDIDNEEVEADDSTISSPIRRARSPSISNRRRKPFIPEDGPHAAQSVLIGTSNTQPVLRPPSASRTRERARSITSVLRPRSPLSSEHHSSASHQPHSKSIRSRANVLPNEQSQTSSPEVIHPLPVPRPVSSLSHRSIPPDNYIPTITPTDHYIPMPPPHELSIPVPSTTPAPAPSEPEAMREDFADYRGQARKLTRSRAASTGSRASTRISEYDLVSPPPHERAGVFPPFNSGLDNGTHNVSNSTRDAGSRRMVEEWRHVMTTPPARVEPEAESRQTTPRIQSPTTAGRSRSPRVSGGPRIRRNIVQPTPLSTEMFSQRDPQGSSNAQQTVEFADTRPQYMTSPPRNPRTEQLQQQDNFQSGPSGSSTSESSPPAGTARTKTPISWFKKRFQRSYSSPVVPNIQIEPPSQTPTSSSSNASSRINPVLLTPEDANRPIALPNEVIAEATRGIAILPSSTPLPNTPITITLPDGELPLGFVPTTPIMNYATQQADGHNHDDSGSMFSPIPDNYSLPDPFRGGTQSPIQRPSTAAASDTTGKEVIQSPRSRATSFGGHWGWASPDSARLSRPISLFSDD
ncbi:hypothetical protein F5890DRAFT_1554094 [Lentinula detonsa]|uniref:Uncharacterized protein n=1 Tax=Lentinula detonsa TaxID=2804962 RepID=A0AA38PZE0_9AGAR|nr:hypothetical protein F5890DRAFT_1554094 [Lentinula detonsa]